MLYIALSIIFSTVLVLLFRQFEKYQINTFQAIFFNYLTCVTAAWVTLGAFPIPSDILQKPYAPFALLLGFVFITGFNAVAGTIKHFSIALGSIMQKMSLLFAVVFSIFYYDETLSWNKIIGFIAAIFAILLTSYSPNNQSVSEKKHHLLDWLLFPATALVASGIIDTVLLYLERSVNTQSADISFIASLFGTAACFGLPYFGYALWTKKMVFEPKNVIAGVVLGIPNFTSIYYLLKSMGQDMDGSVVLTITNVGIIVSATLLGWIFYKEKLSPYKILGVAMAVLAIVLISLF